MAEAFNTTNTRAGILGGTMLSILPNLSSGDILRTVVLAAIGAMVSFLVSMLIKTVVQRIKKKQPLRR